MNNSLRLTKKVLPILAITVAVGYLLWSTNDTGPIKSLVASSMSSRDNNKTVAQPRTLEEPWLFTFDTPGTLHEAGDRDESSSTFWWLSSGGTMKIEDGVGKTAQKAQPATNRWALAYLISNPKDTGKGKYPQNIFRLVSQDKVGDAEVAMSFRITNLNLTDTPNRDAWSGVLLFSRYKDSDNLYYAGVRQDGHVVIKKKINGRYYTLEEKEYFTSHRP